MKRKSWWTKGFTLKQSLQVPNEAVVSILAGEVSFKLTGGSRAAIILLQASERLRHAPKMRFLLLPSTTAAMRIRCVMTCTILRAPH